MEEDVASRFSLPPSLPPLLLSLQLILSGPGGRKKLLPPLTGGLVEERRGEERLSGGTRFKKATVEVGGREG